MATTEQAPNSAIEQWGVVEMTGYGRLAVVAIVDDDDLRFTPGGDAPPFGEICRRIGEVEQSYIDALRTFRQDFSYRTDDPELERSVAALKRWYDDLDRELKEAVAALSEDEVQTRTIERAGFAPTAIPLLHTWREALLVFYGQADVYLRAMGKAQLLPDEWRMFVA